VQVLKQGGDNEARYLKGQWILILRKLSSRLVDNLLVVQRLKHPSIWLREASSCAPKKSTASKPLGR
jgi:hypothetical protein